MLAKTAGAEAQNLNFGDCLKGRGGRSRAVGVRARSRLARLPERDASLDARPPENRVSSKKLMQPFLEGDREAEPQITPWETPPTGCEWPPAAEASLLGPHIITPV